MRLQLVHVQRMSSTKIETDSPWQAAMRKQRRQMWGIIAGTLAMFAAMIIYFWFISPRSNLQWVLGVIALMLIPALLVLLRVARQQRRMTALVPQHEGLVCPKCIVPLVEPTEFSTDQSKLECPKCPRRYNAQDIRKFWDMSIRDPMEATRWLTKRRNVASEKDWHDHIVKASSLLRKNPLVMIAFQAVIWTIAGIGFSLLRGTSVFIGAFTYVHMMVFMSGFMLMTASRKMRLGDSQHCAKCDYQRAPDLNAARCPEWIKLE